MLKRFIVFMDNASVHCKLSKRISVKPLLFLTTLPLRKRGIFSFGITVTLSQETVFGPMTHDTVQRKEPVSESKVHTRTNHEGSEGE
jgi:hypothetical protein